MARNSIVKNCYSTTHISCEPGDNYARAGGICGYAKNNTIISTCYNTGTIYTWGRTIYPGKSVSGGIVGRLEDSNVFACFSTNDTIIARGSSSNDIGRIVGFTYGTFSIESCHALSSMLVNDKALISQDAHSKDGKSEPLSSFQSESWIENNLLYIASGNKRNL